MLVARIVALMVLASMPSSWSQLAPRAHVEDMEKLAAQMRALLPEGWKLEMTPFHESDVASGDWELKQEPHIVIYRIEPVRAWHKESVSFVPPRVPTPFPIKYRISPRISEQGWTAAISRNRRNSELRASYRKRLDHLKDGTLKPIGNDPENYKPKTQEEHRILQEYRFVWPHTHPVALPQYKFRSLSLSTVSPAEYEFRPEGAKAEYSRVAATVNKLLDPYKEKLP